MPSPDRPAQNSEDQAATAVVPATDRSANAPAESSAAGSLNPNPANDWSGALAAYEQPLNERMRTFLRLDFLYHQLMHHEEQSDVWSTRGAVTAILEILAITARGDVRADVLKELERQM